MADNRNGDRFIIRYCRVESVKDDAAGYRIKVRIPYYDPTFEEDPLMDRIPYCFPLLPKLIHVYPKEGEMVFVTLQEQGSVRGDRFFVGPVISQDYYLEKCDFSLNAGTLLQGLNTLPPSENPSMNPENEGTVPERDIVALRGRKNSDVQLLNNELRMRCGFRKNPDGNNEKTSLNFNDKDMVYLQMKYFPNGRTDSTGTYNSVANIVADRINLISNDGKPFFGNADRKSLIGDDKQDDIQNKAHNMVYGDELVAYLRQVIDIFSSHVHPWLGAPPCLIGSEIETLNTDLTKYLSKTIRIN